MNELVKEWSYSEAVERARGVFLDWTAQTVQYRHATIAFGKILWEAYVNLDRKGSSGRSLSGAPTVAQFISDVGIPKRSFYNIISRIKEIVESEGSLDGFSDSIKITSVYKEIADKTPREEELEVKIQELEKDLEEKKAFYVQTIQARKEQAFRLRSEITEKAAEIESLNARYANADVPPSLQKKVDALLDMQATLENQLAPFENITKFKASIRRLLKCVDEIQEFGEKLLN